MPAHFDAQNLPDTAWRKSATVLSASRPSAGIAARYAKVCAMWTPNTYRGQDPAGCAPGAQPRPHVQANKCVHQTGTADQAADRATFGDAAERIRRRGRQAGIEHGGSRTHTHRSPRCSSVIVRHSAGAEHRLGRPQPSSQLLSRSFGRRSSGERRSPGPLPMTRGGNRAQRSGSWAPHASKMWPRIRTSAVLCNRSRRWRAASGISRRIP
jgi:hypothetical protein